MSEPRVPLIAGNWKMNKTIGEAKDLAREVVGGGRPSGVQVMLAPPFTALSAVAEVVNNTDVVLAAQNMHWEDSGAFTGEISPVMLTDLGAKMVIVGHSERRHVFHETDEAINHKVQSALNHGLTPILCIGETLEERKADKVFGVIAAQLEGGLSGLDAERMARVIIAYEPVWAIGTGVNATPEQAQTVHQLIREQLSELFNKGLAMNTRILYGGSAKAANAAELMAQPDVDGLLVGGAALNAQEFLGIINFEHRGS